MAVTVTGPPRPQAARRSAVEPTLWGVYDVLTAFLAVFVATDALNRFGVSSVAWLLIYALVVLRLAVVWRAALALVSANLAYFAYPAVCLASVLWSYNGQRSLEAAIQVAVTLLIALFVGRRFSLGAIALLQFGATFLGVLLSFANYLTGAFGAVYAPAGGVLGIFTQKNMLGQRGLFTVLSAAAIVLSLPGRALAVRLVLVGAVLLTALMIALSKSVTSILLVPVFLAVYLALNLTRLPRVLVVAGGAAAVLALALGPVALAVAGINPVLAILEAFDKSTSLTGRTDLWAIASAVLADHWATGVGFGAFWTAPEFANLTFLAQDIGGDAVVSFHNFILEIWVATGPAGLLAMALLLGTSIRRTLLLWHLTRSPLAAYALVGTLASIALALLGTGLYRQHEFTIMFVVMVGVAAQRELEALRAPPPQP